MISIDEAFDHLDGNLGPLPATTVALTTALGRVLAEPVRSTLRLPPFRQSAMDGYAVARASIADGADLVLPVEGTAAAGAVTPPLPLSPNACQRIYTGAQVPQGCDLVVRQEDVERRDDGTIFVEAATAARLRDGANIREAGEELDRGAMVAPAGMRLTFGAVGAVAMAGHRTVSVHRRPRVAFVVTGDELAEPGEPLRESAVFNANSPMLCAWAERAGVEVAANLCTPDDLELLTMTLAALDADLIVTTGGASVGDRDHLRAAAAAADFREQFWGIAQQPGKPTGFATRGACALLALPGNPAAVFCGLATFGARILSRLEGEGVAAPRNATGLLAAGVRPNPNRDLWLRCALSHSAAGTALLQPLHRQASHMLSNLLDCDALARIPAGTVALEPGATVTWIRP